MERALCACMYMIQFHLHNCIVFCFYHLSICKLFVQSMYCITYDVIVRDFLTITTLFIIKDISHDIA